MKTIIILLLLIGTNIYSQDSTGIGIDIKPRPTTYEMEQQNKKLATPKTRKGTKLTAEQEDSLRRVWKKEKEATTIKLGFTKEQVLERWGEPKDINKTVGSWGVHEQWIYTKTYLYFENSILTSWQEF